MDAVHAPDGNFGWGTRWPQHWFRTPVRSTRGDELFVTVVRAIAEARTRNANIKSIPTRS
jgi:hypothetical protein